jgi:hypothetical protein
MAHVDDLYSEEELQRQFTAATARAAEVDRQEPRAVAASYDKRAKRVVVELATGVIVQIPAQLLQGVAEASPQELAAVTISPQGTALHWKKLDADFSVAGLLTGVFGTQAWMAEVGRKGGQTKSAAKAAAARANGRKGGRPPLHRRPDKQKPPVRAKVSPEDRTASR